MVSEATQEQRHHHEEEAMGIIDTSAVAIAIGLACVAIAGAFYFFKDRFYSSTSSTLAKLHCACSVRMSRRAGPQGPNISIPFASVMLIAFN